jgi:hypothetical protein
MMRRQPTSDDDVDNDDASNIDYVKTILSSEIFENQVENYQHYRHFLDTRTTNSKLIRSSDTKGISNRSIQVSILVL